MNRRLVAPDTERSGGVAHGGGEHGHVPVTTAGRSGGFEAAIRSELRASSFKLQVRAREARGESDGGSATAREVGAAKEADRAEEIGGSKRGRAARNVGGALG